MAESDVKVKGASGRLMARRLVFKISVNISGKICYFPPISSLATEGSALHCRQTILRQFWPPLQWPSTSLLNEFNCLKARGRGNE